ncbi:hypothetical protein [Nonomuraea ceibae]|uniref:hypothetical protein n=1 Tax=Nonomuraea ceibae TaxID=1935170 RepID=UPI001C5FBBAF|nr:hypothetical protein [Nonomuraea ceibae]
MFLNPALVHRMVDVTLAAHDTVITYGEPNLHRQMWEDTPVRKGIERRMRAQLLGKVAEEGCVPVELPTTTYRYFAEPTFYTLGALTRREVPPELVELGAPWEWVEVELSIPARQLACR